MQLLVRWLVLALGVMLALPFILITMGLGVLLINALLFLLVGELVNGFVVDGFWSALGGSLVVSVTNLVVSAVTRSAKIDPPAPPKQKPKGDDVIDI